MLYIFGGLLIYSGIRVFFTGDHQIDPAANPVVKALRRWIPVTDEYQGGKFLVREWKGNPAPLRDAAAGRAGGHRDDRHSFRGRFDSCSAGDHFECLRVYTSNVFAILGLRSMYFAVAELIKIFRFLHYGLAVVLILVGVKMMAADYYPIPIGADAGRGCGGSG